MRALHHELFLFLQSRNCFRNVPENEIEEEILGLEPVQPEKPKRPQDSLYPWTQPIYVKPIIYYQKKHQLKNWMKMTRNDIRKL